MLDIVSTVDIEVAGIVEGSGGSGSRHGRHTDYTLTSL